MKDSGASLNSVFKGAARHYAPLSRVAVDRILALDAEEGFGPCGTRLNRTRFYLYLVQRGSDVEVRTVAVKAAARRAAPVLKEVARASVDDPWMHIRDLGFMGMSGYVVDWTPEGFGMDYHWSYAARWEDELYGLRCMWKINARVVNPELLKRTRRFRFAEPSSSNAHLLDYLKVYNNHPKIELMAKAGLGRFSTNTGLLNRLEKNEPFRRFFMGHLNEIRRDRITIPEINMAFRSGISFAEAKEEIEARRRFKYMGLPRRVLAVKAKAYCEARRIRLGEYTEYLKNCQLLGLDLADTKICFPKQFKRRAEIVKEQADAARRKSKAEFWAGINRKIGDMAAEWDWLESHRGAYRFVIPRSDAELIAEGRAMANCLGQPQYAEKIARGQSLVVFVRQACAADAAFLAVEYDLKRGMVTQCYGAKNSKPPKPARDFVERAFSGVLTKRVEVAA